MSTSFDVDDLVDQQRIDRFNVLVVAWSFLTMLADGYDLTAMAFAAPELVNQWGIQTESLGMVFSASLFGILFGAPLLGLAGDRFGRRTAILVCLAICGLGTLGMVAATTTDHLFALRFIAGIGIGGLMPNTISLTSELSPQRYRARMIIFMFVGITVGGGLPGIISATLVPIYGWQILFWIGGFFPLAVAVGLYFVLPESIKWLARHDPGSERALRVARRMRTDLSLPNGARIVADHESATARTVANVFEGGLIWITPLLWFSFAATLMANFFLNSWMPLLFVRTGMSPEEAAVASGLYHVGGTLGGLLISVLVDRCGVTVVAMFLALAAPIVAAIGIESLPHTAVHLLSFTAGIAVLGAQFGNNASAGLIYPTGIRGRAVGLAFGIGRFGSILGPLLGGYVIARNYPLDQMFRIAALPLVLAAVAAALLSWHCWKRFGSIRLHE